MPYCVNCGKEYPIGAKFCGVCGTRTGEVSSERISIFEGTIHKCPNCGEPSKSFETHCLACGFEFRDISKNKIQDFSELINRLQEEKKAIKTTILNNDQMLAAERQIISLIRNYSIPNTKEDIIDFMILASSNIDVNDFTSIEDGSYKKSISNAWFAKFEQAYEKAKICFSDDDLKIVNAIYDKKMKQIRKARLSFPKIVEISIIGTVSFFVFVIFYLEKVLALLI
ncbi:MAG: zinc ribbon domain-containing protein [Oscillospiraceae bacterium]|nr:zinc ribbon domain-containing protein [Oscillospiraceae bacterium]MDY2863652.1 zinc ribbon domain-containing protein [Oscillospiraceae bacterium]